MISITSAVWSTSRLSTRAGTFHSLHVTLGKYHQETWGYLLLLCCDTRLYISSRPGETHQIEKLMECIVENISNLRPTLSMSNAEMLFNYLHLTSRLDYCNALLGGCSARLINKLQMV